MDGTGKSVGIGDVRAQTKAVLDTIKSIVEAGGGRLADIAFNSIFLKDLSDYAAEILPIAGTMVAREAPGKPRGTNGALTCAIARIRFALVPYEQVPHERQL